MITAQDDDSALRIDGFEATAALLDLLLEKGMTAAKMQQIPPKRQRATDDYL